MASAAGALIGAAALLSWIRGPSWLRSIAGPVEMQPNTSIGIVLLGLGALAMTRPGRRFRRLARALGVTVATLGALTVLEHALGVDLRIDQAFVQVGAAGGGAGVTSPGRMGPPAALNLLLAGLAVTLGTLRARRAVTAGQVLVLGVAPLPLVALVGYAYDAAVLYSAPGLSAIALPTAIALLAIDLAVLLGRPTVGLMANLVSRGAGSAIARRMLIYVIAVPSTLGWAALALGRGHPPRGGWAVHPDTTVAVLVAGGGGDPGDGGAGAARRHGARSARRGAPARPGGSGAVAPGAGPRAPARAGGAQPRRGGEPGAGRVPERALPRAADAAQRHPGLDAPAARRRRGPGAAGPRAGGGGAERAGAGGGGLRPARHVAHHPRRGPAGEDRGGPGGGARGGGGAGPPGGAGAGRGAGADGG
ncbi:MAG: hypothetical protein QM767_00080 [Anaeromyxobacter sp.]